MKNTTIIFISTCSKRLNFWANNQPKCSWPQKFKAQLKTDLKYTLKRGFKSAKSTKKLKFSTTVFKICKLKVSKDYQHVIRSCGLKWIQCVVLLEILVKVWHVIWVTVVI